MIDADPPTTSAAQLDALGSAMPQEAFAGPSEEAVQVFNFRFASDMAPGWILARAREVETGRGVRLVQVNARAEDSDQIARIEILETHGPEAGRKLFMETLARFQCEPATMLRVPPQIGEAEASLGQSAFAFLRGNLVAMVTAIGPAAQPVEELARQLDRSICEKPEVPAESEDQPRMRGADAGRQMIKVFTPRGAHGSEGSERFAIAPDGRARRLREPGNGSRGGGDRAG